ncbi:MAG: TonB-dependent receptor [Bacteroidales bacterium]|nr:TonB-dependent receptor [Bacteroidales bacterium]
MAGVNVLEKGTINGVMTGADGKFSITVASPKSVLSFSFIGYETKDVTVGAQTVISVTLTETVTGLEEVVVIGYGTQRKEAVTGSVASISGNVLRDVPSGNITTALQARIPGVDMEQTSSKPGSTMQIRVRGTRSLNAINDPLVVVDGIPFAGSLGDLNPNDIKSLDILKDASATAIYGSRGANGVILITTTKGQIGQKAQVTLNSYYGLKTVFAPYPMMDGPEFVALRKAAFWKTNYTNSLDEADDVNTDWQDLFYRTGSVTSTDLGISGGTEKGSYTFGIGYFQDKAVIPTQQYERFSMRGTLDQEIGKFFRFGFTTNNNYNITKGTQLDLGAVLALTPIANPYNADGSWKRTIKMPLDEYWTNTREIADSLSDKWLSQTKAYGSYNSLYGEVKIPGVEGLKYRVNIGLNFRMSNAGSYTGEGINSSTATTVSTASISNSLTTNWAIENLLTYDRTFAGKHQVNVVALYSAEQSMYNSSYVSAKDIPADAFQFYNLGRAAGEIAVNPDYQGYNMSGLISWMGRVMYSYDNRYMLSVSYRSDASSVLAPGHKWHSYPAVSAGWNIKNESFMKDIAPITSLKLRVGYGETSNQSVNPYSTLGLLATRPYNFGTAYSTGYYVSSLPNPNLGWEFSKTWNFGLDFGLLKNRLTGTVEYYIMNTNDVLLSVNLPATSGVNSYMANIGKTQNKGLEIALNGVILNNLRGFTWDAGINLYANRNKLVALASGQVKDEFNWWFVGHPINVIYDWEATGLWQASDPYLNILEPGGNAGMIKVKYTGDYAADGVTPSRAINASDRQIIDVEPDFQGGFNTRVTYKGFDLSVVGAFQKGGILISTLYGDQSYLNILTARRGNIKVDYWTPTDTIARFPRPGGLGGDQPKYLRSLSYFDASFLKIRTITLAYNLDQNNWIKKAGIDKLRLYITLQNPLVMFSPYHKESGMDPETNSYGNENSATTSFYRRRLLTLGTNTPSTRNYLIGINLTF